MFPPGSAKADTAGQHETGCGHTGDSRNYSRTNCKKAVRPSRIGIFPKLLVGKRGRETLVEWWWWGLLHAQRKGDRQISPLDVMPVKTEYVTHVAEALSTCRVPNSHSRPLNNCFGSPPEAEANAVAHRVCITRFSTSYNGSSCKYRPAKNLQNRVASRVQSGVLQNLKSQRGN